MLQYLSKPWLSCFNMLLDASFHTMSICLAAVEESLGALFGAACPRRKMGLLFMHADSQTNDRIYPCNAALARLGAAVCMSGPAGGNEGYPLERKLTTLHSRARATCTQRGRVRGENKDEAMWQPLMPLHFDS